MPLVLTAYDGGPALTFTIDPRDVDPTKPLTFTIAVQDLRLGTPGHGMGIRSARVAITAPDAVRVLRDKEGEALFRTRKFHEQKRREPARPARAATDPTQTSPATGKEQP